MKHKINYYLSFIAYVSKCIFPRMLFICLISGLGISVHAAEDRFAPPNLAGPANSFNSRFTANGFNVDFLLAHIINNSRQLERAGADLSKNTTFITDTVNSIDGAISNSVIVQPGTTADTIIILNQNEGDSFAIQR